MPQTKGSVVYVNSSGKLSCLTPGADNTMLVADSSNVSGIKYVTCATTTNIVVVDKGGSDSTGARNGKPFLTVTAGLAVAQSGDVVLVYPGTYAESVTVPNGVNLRGMSTINTILSRTGVTGNTDLVTLGTSCLVENLTLNLTSTSHFRLRAIVFASTSATTSQVRNCAITIDNSTASAGTSDVIGVYSAGTGVAPDYMTNLENVTANILSTSSGLKRGILLDTNTNTINAKNCNFRTSGGTDSIGAEVNFASAVLTLRYGYCEGTVADVSQTAGTLNIAYVKLQNSNANGKSFNTVDVFPNTIQYSLSGAVTGGATRYMRISDAVTANEIKQRMYKKCLLKNMYVRARVGPGGAVSDVYTVRKNGADTSLVSTITGSATTASMTNVSVTYSADDDFSLKLVTGAGSVEADMIITCEVY